MARMESTTLLSDITKEKTIWISRTTLADWKITPTSNSKNRSNSWSNKSENLKKHLKMPKPKRKQHTRVVLSKPRSTLNKMLKPSQATPVNWTRSETSNIKSTKNMSKKRLKCRKLSETNLLKNWTNQNSRA